MKEHKKAGSETGVKSDLAFCLGSLIKKTNSASRLPLKNGLKSTLEVEVKVGYATFTWLFVKKSTLKSTSLDFKSGKSDLDSAVGPLPLDQLKLLFVSKHSFY